MCRKAGGGSGRARVLVEVRWLQPLASIRQVRVRDGGRRRAEGGRWGGAGEEGVGCCGLLRQLASALQVTMMSHFTCSRAAAQAYNVCVGWVGRGGGRDAEVVCLASSSFCLLLRYLWGGGVELRASKQGQGQSKSARHAEVVFVCVGFSQMEPHGHST
jgi:hypothetical protein